MELQRGKSVLPPFVTQPGCAKLILFLWAPGTFFFFPDLFCCLNVASEYCGRKLKHAANSYNHVLLLPGFSSANPHLGPNYRWSRMSEMTREIWAVRGSWQQDQTLRLWCQLRKWRILTIFCLIQRICALWLFFPFWHGAEVWQGSKCHGPGGLISFVPWLPREDVEVSFQYFVSYCVATSWNCQVLAFSHPGEGLHHRIFRKK